MHTVLDDTPECGYTRFPVLIEGAAGPVCGRSDR
ncbi:hypothetical protein HD592_001967 [Schaalia hyovaginalis]|uniref:Uncharacterized protein n=1 Tax=Schaalia hyovaginalis TaxID=29316 RepID=A0A923E5Y7_9ACTO|nr:hypothetical protein [Schaalia hyovaginalis]